MSNSEIVWPVLTLTVEKLTVRDCFSLDVYSLGASMICTHLSFSSFVASAIPVSFP